EPPLLARLALFGKRRRPAPVAEKASVAPASATTASGQPPVAFAEQVGDDRAVLLLDRRPLGDGHHGVGPVGAVPPSTLAVDAVRRPPERMVLEAEERRHVAVGDQPHVATVAAVAPVGPTARRVRLPPKRHRARPAIAGAHMQLRLVDEPGSHGFSLRAASTAFSGWIRPSQGLIQRKNELFDDVDELAALAGAELDLAGGEGEERVVAADADVLTGVDAGAALADDDGAGVHLAAVEDLHAEPLGLGIAAVPSRTAALGLAHLLIPVISIVL